MPTLSTTRTTGLIASGRFGRSAAAKLPRLTEQLGPVKASSYRVASRIVNTVNAGHPVHDYQAFEPCPLILICLEAEVLDDTIAELASSTLRWAGRAVLLCDSGEDSTKLAALSGLGAECASFDRVAGRVVMEGDRSAVRVFRRALLGSSTRVLQLAPGGKTSFLAGITLASLPAYLAAGSDLCFRNAGSNPSVSMKLVQDLIADSVRSYRKSGRKALDNRWTPESLATIARQHTALCSSHPEVASYFVAAVHAAMTFSSQPLPPDLAAQFRPSEPEEAGCDYQAQDD